jgi:hypothetical protein
MKKILILCLLLLAPTILPAQEVVTLATPQVKTAPACALDTLILDVTRSRIVAQLVCPGGDPVSKQYDAFTTPTGAALMTQVNRGNFSGATSLVRAIYNRLITDGVISGTVSGTAQ